jgi:nucleoside-diphosphate-sugar epimerase
MSSFSVFDYLKLENGDTITEDSPLEPEPECRGAYSWAKVEAERVAVAALQKESPAWTVLRPSLIFGRRGDTASVAGPRIGRWVLALGGQHKHLRLVHVTDVARAIRLALESEATKHRIFNLSHADAVTVRDVIRECFWTTHLKRVRGLPIPTFVVAIARPLLAVARILLRRGPQLTRARWAYVTRDLTADVSAFKEATGWEPSAPLLEQLRREIEVPECKNQTKPDRRETVMADVGKTSTDGILTVNANERAK